MQRYIEAARDAGCPPDQIKNFLRAGIVLQPQQLKASAAARLCDQPDGPEEIGMGGARGGGKSFWSIAQMAADDAQRWPGSRFLFLRKVGKAARESFESLRQKALMGLPHRYSEGVLRFPNGSVVVVGHFQNESDVDAYLGLEYDGIAIEESTLLSVTKQKMIATCNRTSLAGVRPRRYHTTNPGGISHAEFKKKFIVPFRRGTESRTRFVPATYRDNRVLNPEYVKVLNDLAGWHRRAWRDGDWDIAAGQFFANWIDEIHVVQPFAIPKHWRVWAAMDYGWVHPTAVLIFAQDDDGHIYVVGEHAMSRWLPQLHVRALSELLDQLGLDWGRLETFVAGADVFVKRDPSGQGTVTDDPRGKSIADHYGECGVTLAQAKIDRIQGAGAVLQLLGDVAEGIEPRLWVFSTCHRLAEQIPAMIHDPKRPEDVLKVDIDDSGEGGDDLYDAARYGLMEAWDYGGWSTNLDFLKEMAS